MCPASYTEKKKKKPAIYLCIKSYTWSENIYSEYFTISNCMKC